MGPVGEAWISTLHLGGQINYQPTTITITITITLDRPDTPRITAALELLTDELNTGAAHLLGDRRPIRYQITQPLSMIMIDQWTQSYCRRSGARLSWCSLG